MKNYVSSKRSVCFSKLQERPSDLTKITYKNQDWFVGNTVQDCPHLQWLHRPGAYMQVLKEDIKHLLP